MVARKHEDRPRIISFQDLRVAIKQNTTQSIYCNQDCSVTAESDPFGLLNVAVLPTKIGQLQLALVVDEKVLRLQVSVEDFSFVAVGQTAQQLEHEDLQEGGVKERRCTGSKGNAAVPTQWPYLLTCLTYST